jgi:hypothetical protein
VEVGDNKHHLMITMSEEEEEEEEFGEKTIHVEGERG